MSATSSDDDFVFVELSCGKKTRPKKSRHRSTDAADARRGSRSILMERTMKDGDTDDSRVDDTGDEMKEDLVEAVPKGVVTSGELSRDSSFEKVGSESIDGTSTANGGEKSLEEMQNEPEQPVLEGPRDDDETQVVESDGSLSARSEPDLLDNIVEQVGCLGLDDSTPTNALKSEKASGKRDGNSEELWSPDNFRADSSPNEDEEYEALMVKVISEAPLESQDFLRKVLQKPWKEPESETEDEEERERYMEKQEEFYRNLGWTKGGKSRSETPSSDVEEEVDARFQYESEKEDERVHYEKSNNKNSFRNKYNICSDSENEDEDRYMEQMAQFCKEKAAPYQSKMAKQPTSDPKENASGAPLVPGGYHPGIPEGYHPGMLSARYSPQQYDSPATYTSEEEDAEKKIVSDLNQAQVDRKPITEQFSYDSYLSSSPSYHSGDEDNYEQNADTRDPVRPKDFDETVKTDGSKLTSSRNGNPIHSEPANDEQPTGLYNEYSTFEYQKMKEDELMGESVSQIRSYPNGRPSDDEQHHMENTQHRQPSNHVQNTHVMQSPQNQWQNQQNSHHANVSPEQYGPQTPVPMREQHHSADRSPIQQHSTLINQNPHYSPDPRSQQSRTIVHNSPHSSGHQQMYSGNAQQYINSSQYVHTTDCNRQAFQNGQYQQPMQGAHTGMSHPMQPMNGPDRQQDWNMRSQQHQQYNQHGQYRQEQISSQNSQYPPNFNQNHQYSQQGGYNQQFQSMHNPPQSMGQPPYQQAMYPQNHPSQPMYGGPQQYHQKSQYPQQERQFGNPNYQNPQSNNYGPQQYNQHQQYNQDMHSRNSQQSQQAYYPPQPQYNGPPSYSPMQQTSPMNAQFSQPGQPTSGSFNHNNRYEYESQQRRGGDFYNSQPSNGVHQNMQYSNFNSSQPNTSASYNQNYHGRQDHYQYSQTPHSSNGFSHQHMQNGQQSSAMQQPWSSNPQSYQQNDMRNRQETYSNEPNRNEFLAQRANRQVQEREETEEEKLARQEEENRLSEEFIKSMGAEIVRQGAMYQKIYDQKNENQKFMMEAGFAVGERLPSRQANVPNHATNGASHSYQKEAGSTGYHTRDQGYRQMPTNQQGPSGFRQDREHNNLQRPQSSSSSTYNSTKGQMPTNQQGPSGFRQDRKRNDLQRQHSSSSSSYNSTKGQMPTSHLGSSGFRQDRDHNNLQLPQSSSSSSYNSTKGNSQSMGMNQNHSSNANQSQEKPAQKKLFQETPILVQDKKKNNKEKQVPLLNSKFSGFREEYEQKIKLERQQSGASNETVEVAPRIPEPPVPSKLAQKLLDQIQTEKRNFKEIIGNRESKAFKELWKKTIDYIKANNAAGKQTLHSIMHYDSKYWCIEFDCLNFITFQMRGVVEVKGIKHDIIFQLVQSLRSQS